MKKFIIVVLLALAAVLNAQDFQRYINVNGSSELTVSADQMEIGINIRTVEKSIEESKKTNDRSVNELIGSLNNIGVDKKDIEISPISLGKNFEYKQGERVQNGYFTNVNVSVLLKDLTKYYDMIDNISKNDLFEISNSRYKISGYESNLKIVYKDAILAAKEKAELMANALGVKLGEVIEIDENNNYASPMPLNSFAKEDYQSGGIEGKVTISRSVRVKFAIM